MKSPPKSVSAKRAIAEGIRYREEITLEDEDTKFQHTFTLRPLTDIEVRRLQAEAMSKMKFDWEKVKEHLGIEKLEELEGVGNVQIGAAIMKDSDLGELAKAEGKSRIMAVAQSLSPHPFLAKQGIKEDGVEEWSEEEVGNLPTGWPEQLWRVVFRITGGLAAEAARAGKFPD